DQVRTLHAGTPLLERQPDGRFLLGLELKKSTDLNNFAPFDFSGGTLTPDPSNGRLELRFAPEDDAAFFRVEAK
nr:hypothetical protein [Akkermansiaceae bacterium]